MPQMNRKPQVIVWHAQAEAYRDALLERLPGARVDAITSDREGATERAPSLDPAAVLWTWKVPEGILPRMPSLEWIQVTGAGVDHFLGTDGLRPDVVITRSLGRFGVQVAEYVVGQLLAHLLDVTGYRERQLEHRWDRRDRPLLADRTVGVVGLGSLGLPIARALAAMGARVLGVRHSEGDVETVDEVFSFDRWRSMLPRCDALVLAAPKTSRTVGMVDAEALAALPRGAVLINVARGDLVDDDALLAALDAGDLAAAILDVFRTEPLPDDHPLWSHPRAWVTPHIAAPSEIGPMVDEFVENYRRFVAGEPLLNVVDRERGY